MTLALALVSLAGLLGLVRLWSLRKSRGALLTMAVPAALLPLATGAVAGAWQYRAAWERIGETGTGGLATVIGNSRDWMEALLLGCVLGVGVMGTAIVLAFRHHDHTAPVNAGRRQRATALIVVAGMVSIAVMGVVVARSERAAIGPLVKFVPLATADAAPDLGYSTMRSMPTQDMLAQLERDLRMATTGGTTIAVVLAVCLLAGALVRSMNGAGRVLTTATVLIAVALLGAGVWYGLHAQSVTRLLDATARL